MLPISTWVRGCSLQNGNLLAFENLNFYKPCHSLLQIYQFALVFGFQLLKWNDSVKTAWTSSDAGYCVYEVLVSHFSYYILVYILYYCENYMYKSCKSISFSVGVKYYFLPLK